MLSAALNVFLGLLAILPLGFTVSLVAFYADGPYGLGTNHTYATIGGRPAPWEIDTDEAFVVLPFVIGAGAVLAGLFFAVNLAARRRLRFLSGALYWGAAALVFLTPFLVFLARWWF